MANHWKVISHGALAMVVRGKRDAWQLVGEFSPEGGKRRGGTRVEWNGLQEDDDDFSVHFLGESIRRIWDNHTRGCSERERESPRGFKLTRRQCRRVCSDSPGCSRKDDDEIVPFRRNALKHFPNPLEVIPHGRERDQ